ncbi:MAG: carbohydrate binding domain-containing protein [Candidatus Saganbacteria bacterium]|nr:carbohydrate binding domain-containing protein [Candidatus Saganbacteria bacterium]
MFKFFMRKAFILIICFCFFAAPANAIEQNLLKNGDFESGLVKGLPAEWGKEPYNASLGKDGPSGKSYLRIINKKESMSLGAQSFPLDGRKIRYIYVSTQVKGTNVTLGKDYWMKANLQPLFFDEKGNQVGGWPELGPWEGTFDWAFAKKMFVVPPEARTLKIVLGLYGAKGEVDFDDVKVVVPPPKDSDPYNLVSNGDFEIWEDWAYGGTEGGGVVSPGHESAGMLYINNKDSSWSFASQSIPLDGDVAKTIKTSAFVKIENVKQGPRPWQQARLNIEFKDKDGKRLGGWPIIGSYTGTFDWQKVEQEFAVPPGTKRVDFFIGLMEVPGSLWVDSVKLEAFDANGNQIKKADYSVTDTSNWFTLQPPKETGGKTAADVSFLLDKPAGKHGFLTARDGHFYFQDGTPGRFWGINIYGSDCFPDKKRAEKIAERLARYGCNLVRIHHLDAYWANPNLFDQKYNDTRHLNKESLDRMDYFVAQLEKRGIYIFMDLLVDRQFKEGDGVADYKNVERGAKICGFFDRKVVDLQKEYAKELLTHKNPYTKKRYVDDPGIVSVKLINEAMLFYVGTMFNLSPYYAKELDSLWNTWLLRQYGSRENLEAAWSDKYGRHDLGEDETPVSGNVKRGETLLRFQRSGFEKAERMRDYDTMRFYAEVQEGYYAEMQSFLKGLGVRVPMSGSNHWVNIAADVKTNASLDYIDRHRYWDHPQYGYGTNIVYENLPMVKYPKDALPNNFAFYKVAGLPFAISEWNCCFPSDYRVEGPLMMAAYSVLQDWDAVLQFSYNGKEWGTVMDDNFDLSTWPHIFSQWPAAALLFHRKDVSVAKNVVEEDLLPSQVFGPIFEDEAIAGEPLLPLISKTQIHFVENRDQVQPSNSEALVEKFHDEEKKMVSSDTEELLWDYGNGIFSINTGRTQALVGFVGGEWLSLQNLSVNSSTKFASIALSSLSRDPIAKSKRMLLTAGGRAENTEQKYNAVRTQLKEVGKKPVLIEGVEAEISIVTQVKPKSVSVFALDLAGNRTKKLPVILKGGKFSFKIGPQYKALLYEIVLQ